QFVYGVLVDSNKPSIALHQSLGFKEAGHFYNAGYKLGKWRGILWMQKQIGELLKVPQEIKTVDEVVKLENEVMELYRKPAEVRDEN
ncbi:MAG: hypothetical protein Q4B70_04675, partial [Lachnospiraceae bacterium]|nr:hypothetical protein [Lachnospiraceae bacterium]